ncbi:MAG: SMP-30/gluconolactonase/LRE family protein [Planctomycetes bacterium]|nr:SMP-30/gluconolactonase/LRE family protein [Planctomycetota bacterium]
MNARGATSLLLALGGGLFASSALRAQHVLHSFDELPDAGVDLATGAGAMRVQARWSFLPVEITPVAHRAVGADLKPSGPANRTFDVLPSGAASALASSGWRELAPEELVSRRGDGKLCFGWYRLQLELPTKLDSVPVEGGALFLEVVVDDLAEIWIDGEHRSILGTRGGSSAAGWNAPNRVQLTSHARSAQRFEIAIFAANAPLSQPPGNYLWIRSAALELYRAERARIGTALELPRAALRAQRGDGAELRLLAEGFGSLRGLAWTAEQGLLLADAAKNTVYRLAEDGELHPYRVKSGAASTTELARLEPGARAIASAGDGRFDFAEGGRARIARIERNGVVRVLLDASSAGGALQPFALVARRDGVSYASDAEHGALFTLGLGVPQRVATPLPYPGALAFDASERALYVADAREPKLWITALAGDGSPAFETRELPLGAPARALAIDAFGRIFAAEGRTLTVRSRTGEELGSLSFEEPLTALTWIDAARRTLACASAHALHALALGPAVGAEPLDPRWTAIFASELEPELLADERTWIEGPAWDAQRQVLYFSDIPRNAVYAWSASAGVREHLPASGWSGPGEFLGREPGSNGLLLDAAGRLILCEHGNRRLTRLETNGTRTVLAAGYDGKRLNSPNDVCAGPDGALYFTDPPFGLPLAHEDPSRELAFCGVYRLRADGSLELLLDHLRSPNGIAVSPDGRTLYVSDAVPEHPRWLAYELRADGSLGAERVLHDGRRFAGTAPGGADGIEVHPNGTVLSAGPGGVYAFAPDGALLGILHLGSAVSNVELDLAGGALYITAGRRLWRAALRPPAREHRSAASQRPPA